MLIEEVTSGGGLEPSHFVLRKRVLTMSIGTIVQSAHDCTCDAAKNSALAHLLGPQTPLDCQERKLLFGNLTVRAFSNRAMLSQVQ